MDKRFVTLAKVAPILVALALLALLVIGAAATAYAQTLFVHATYSSWPRCSAGPAPTSTPRATSAGRRWWPG
jgi:hypothetical protein